MKRLFIFSLVAFLLFLFDPSQAKKGFKGSGFKSYKSYNYKQKYINPSKAKTKQTYNKQKQTKDTKTPFFQTPVFKWLIGSMVFGAILSFIFGYGFSIGMPGLLEILFIAGILYFVYKKVKKGMYQKEIVTNEGITLKVDSHQINTPRERINETFLKGMIKDMYIQLQTEKSRGDVSPLRDMFTDKLYNYLEMQLLELTERGLKNVIKDVDVKNVDIIHVEDKEDRKIVVAEIEAQMVDYIEDSNGNIISGNPDRPKKVKEYWTIVGSVLNWKLDDIKQVEG